MPKTFLHVGCGSATKNSTTKAFAETQWHEVRLDIDPAVQPDIVGTTTDMSVVTSESVDALFSSHNIEHLYAHEVPLALREFLRVLKPDGFAVITCPDLRSVAELIAADKLTDAVYMSAAGPDYTIGHPLRPQGLRGRGQPLHGAQVRIYQEGPRSHPTGVRIPACRHYGAGCALL